MPKIATEEHKLLTLWAADCADHVLYLFENNHPDDDRPRKAIEAARAWVRGEIKMSEARRFAFAAHAAARDASNPNAIAAARTAGHAAATAHVPGHAKHAATYALKASTNIDTERAWHLQCIPDGIKSMIETN